MRVYYFTSESVSEGHPDKVADQISDAVLDYFISKDKNARVACETLVTTNKVVLAGEIKANFAWSKEDINKVVVEAIKLIGYEQEGFHWKNLSIDNYLHAQSAHIAQGVDEGVNKEEGAGDQGIMFGYACDDTSELMPFTIYYSHRILEELSKKRKNNEIKGLLQDAKSQVTIEYEDGIPKRIQSVVVSHQHIEGLTQQDVEKIVMPVLKSVFPESLYNPNNCIHHINPTGLFVIGGPDGDSGLTGRKIIVDTYGGVAPHGGGAFSGKDPTKVDRSAAYIARYLAKNIVSASLAKKCTIQLSYAIGVAQPVSIFVDTHNTSKINPKLIEDFIKENVDLSPKGIRTRLKLNNPIYLPTASYGHFGRQSYVKDGIEYFTWEKLDLVDSLKKAFN